MSLILDKCFFNQAWWVADHLRFLDADDTSTCKNSRFNIINEVFAVNCVNKQNDEWNKLQKPRHHKINLFFSFCFDLDWLGKTLAFKMHNPDPALVGRSISSHELPAVLNAAGALTLCYTGQRIVLQIWCSRYDICSPLSCCKNVVKRTQRHTLIHYYVSTAFRNEYLDITFKSESFWFILLVNSG